LRVEGYIEGNIRKSRKIRRKKIDFDYVLVACISVEAELGFALYLSDSVE
jgi:hypothetical protein